MADLILYYEVTDGENRFGISANLGPQREELDYMEIAEHVDKGALLRTLCLDHIDPSAVRAVTAEEYRELTGDDI